jgi:hypothetical protein
MAPLPFQGNAAALSSGGLAQVSASLGVYEAEIWTVLAVETSGCGYLPDRRPQILFERHIFHRLTNGQHDDGDISDSRPGGYGRRGAPQYERLERAINKDRAAALQSASWGIGQIMGMNYARAGFRNVEDMVAAMSDSEDQQLAAMAAFLSSTGLAASLQAHDWAAFARGYNGPNYAVNRYDIRLSSEFQKYSTGPLPDLSVRAAQVYLTYLGFDPGRIDGRAKKRTLAAWAKFQNNNGIPPAASLDDKSIAQLQAGLNKAAAAAG